MKHYAVIIQESNEVLEVFHNFYEAMDCCQNLRENDDSGWDLTYKVKYVPNVFDRTISFIKNSYYRINWYIFDILHPIRSNKKLRPRK